MKNLKEENIYLDMKPVGTTSTAHAVMVKTVEVGKAIVTTPIEVVTNTSSTVLDTTLRGGAEQIGIVETRTTETISKDDATPKSVKVV